MAAPMRGEALALTGGQAAASGTGAVRGAPCGFELYDGYLLGAGGEESCRACLLVS